MPPHNAARRKEIRRRRTVAGLVLIALLAAVAGTALALSGNDHHAPPRPRVAVPSQTDVDPHQAARLNVYAHTGVGMLTPITRRARYLIYAPDSQGDGVYVIDPHTDKVIRFIQTGAMVQHVVPAWNLKTLYATNDVGNSLTPINPDTGQRAGPNIPVTDPYNLYFTPDGRHALVVEEAEQTLAFRNPQTFALQKALDAKCPGIDHMDFSADGSFALASCEFSGLMVKIDLATETVGGYVHVGGSPQDVKLSPDGRVFYVANRYVPAQHSSGVQLIDAQTLRVIGFIHTPLDTHGIYVSRNAKELYVSDRAGGAITVIDAATRRVVATWRIGGTPDMGNVSPDGKILWMSGRYTGRVYAISTQTGKLLASIPAGVSPHGVCVWPEPGRYSVGHTGIMR